MKNWILCVLGAVAVAVLAAVSYVPTALAAGAAVIVLSVVVGIGWPSVVRAPVAPAQGAVIAAAGIAAAVLGVLDPIPSTSAAMLRWLPLVAGIGFLAIFVVQLVRGTGQPRLLESAVGGFTGVIAVTLGCGWVALVRSHDWPAGGHTALVVAVAVIFALGVSLLRWPDRIVAPLGVVLAALAAPLASLPLHAIPIGAAVLIGALAGAVVVSVRRLLLEHEDVTGWPARLAVSVAPVLALGAPVFFIDRLMTL